MDRISLLAQYASGVYTDQEADLYTFLSLSNIFIDKFKDKNLWQLQLIESLFYALKARI